MTLSLIKSSSLKVVLTLASLISSAPLLATGLSVGPYASVSSTKQIKPSTTSSSSETTTQRTTYGLLVDARLSSLFSLQVKAGVNSVNTSKKASVMRDEFGEIDFQKDANVNPNAQNATYQYKEEQRVGTAQLLITPHLTSGIMLLAGAGVRARQRLISIRDDLAGTSSSVKAPITYKSLATAGVNLRLLKAFSAKVLYTFYFTQFPKLQPHEQEMLISFGVSI